MNLIDIGGMEVFWSYGVNYLHPDLKLISNTGRKPNNNDYWIEDVSIGIYRVQRQASATLDGHLMKFQNLKQNKEGDLHLPIGICVYNCGGRGDQWGQREQGCAEICRQW